MSGRHILPLILVAFASAARADDEIDHAMSTDPVLPTPKIVKTFSPRLTELWLQALGRPEVEPRFRAAEAIALAHAQGMRGLDTTADALLRELDRADPNPTVTLAVSRALITLDVKASADRLAKVANAGDPDLRELIEPALARWNYEPARAVWLERLGRQQIRRPVVLAARGLAAVGEMKAVPRLRELSLAGQTPPPVRVEAARALGILRPAGGEADAELLLDPSKHPVVARLAAAEMLRRHQGAPAIRLLQTLARDPEPTVAAIALQRLIEIDPHLIEPSLTAVLANNDANVRGLGVACLSLTPNDDHVRLLADRLADPDTGVRTKARRALIDTATRGTLKGDVIREGTRVLNEKDWRGLEQAANLLTHLDHKPAAARLVSLLRHERPEVRVTAAWGLRRLDVPDTLRAALDHVVYVRDGRKIAADQLGESYDRQVTQLAQFLGRAKYQPADPILRELISPRCRFLPEPRGAAIWALGLLHDGKPVPAVAAALAGRVAAVVPTDVEDDFVRTMSAVSLGRMKAASALPTLREFYGDKKPSLSSVNNACGWAIERITGEVVPPPGVVEQPQQNWFLAPIDTRRR